MKTDSSAQWFERAQRVIPGGINSNVRANWDPFPLFYSHGKGSRLWDVDGNEYIDYVLGRGPLMYGHSPDRITDAAAAQMKKGLMYAGQCTLEVELAEKMCELVDGLEQVRFNSSGSESIAAAMRLARSVTNKPVILRFEGHYHGWMDNIAWSFAPPLTEAGPYESPALCPVTKGQLMDDSHNLALLPWNNLDLVEELFRQRHHEIAAVITEAVMCNKGAILPKPGFLEGLRRLCDQYGILLIFDEVITGFRLAPGGARERFDVRPDLTIYAKALGGGMIVSALGGKQQYMQEFGNRTTMHAGTYNANPPAMAGSLAALDMLSENDAELLKTNQVLGQELLNGLKELANHSDLGMQVRGLPNVFNVSFAPGLQVEAVDYRTSLQTDADLTREFYRRMQTEGIRITPEGLWFVSTAHTREDIRQTLTTTEQVLSGMQNDPSIRRKMEAIASGV